MLTFQIDNAQYLKITQKYGSYEFWNCNQILSEVNATLQQFQGVCQPCPLSQFHLLLMKFFIRRCTSVDNRHFFILHREVNNWSGILLFKQNFRNVKSCMLVIHKWNVTGRTILFRHDHYFCFHWIAEWHERTAGLMKTSQ